MFGRLVAIGLAALAPVQHERPERVEPPIPILMYHVIASPLAGAPYPALYVSKREFDAEVRWLAGNGYHAVTLHRVLDDWRGLRELPRKPIVLSFDDGYHSDYTTALPALRAVHWPGVLNLEVNNTKRVWGLGPGLVESLVDAGWEIDAHTITHPDLTHVSPAQLWTEVDGSRQIIAHMFRVPVDFFCYPSGRYDAAVVAAVRRAGYLGATTTRYGLARPSQGLFTLDRVRVSGGEGAAGLAAALTALR